MRSKLWMAAPLLIGVALMGACSDGAGPTEAVKSSDPLIERIVEMGFRRDQIVDAGDHFVVEGDIRFDKKALAAAPRQAPARPGGPLRQRVVSTVAGPGRTIRVNLAAVQAENVSWANATRAALANWSGIAGANITVVEGTPADITVSFANDASFGSACTAAQGSFPLSGNPGTIIRINRLYAASYTAAQQVWIMTHELGHNLGLAHTNTSDGTQVFGTPTSDAGSVMNSGAAFPGCPPAAPAWSAFSNGDQLAARLLYPPQLTVAYVSGQPVASWPAIAGATFVMHRIFVSYGQDEFGSFTAYGNAGDISSVSSPWTDTSWYYTGNQTCHWDLGSGYWMEQGFGYNLEIQLPSGNTFVEAPAEVGVC